MAYDCDPTCLPCENTAQLSNSELSWRMAVLDLLCGIVANGAGTEGLICDDETCDPMQRPCQNTAQIANSELSFRTSVLNLLCLMAQNS